jgi:hypothetical protein
MSIGTRTQIKFNEIKTYLQSVDEKIKQIPGQNFMIPHKLVVKNKTLGMVFVLHRDAYMEDLESKEGEPEVAVALEDGSFQATEYTSPCWKSSTKDTDRYLQLRPFSSVPFTRMINDARDFTGNMKQIMHVVGRGELAIRARYGIDGHPEMIFLGSATCLTRRHLTQNAWVLPSREEFDAFMNQWGAAFQTCGLIFVERK